MFNDMEEAGRLLAEALNSQNLDIDIVLLTSLDSFPLGKEIASALDTPLNSIISTELTSPGKDLAFGAVSEIDTMWLHDGMMEELLIGEKYISKEKKDRMEEIQHKLERVGLDNRPDIRSKNVLLVSSGINSGMEEAASLGAALRAGSRSRIVVSPIISETGLERMGLADDIICLERSSFALSSNEFYSARDRVNQDEIKSYFRA